MDLESAFAPKRFARIAPGSCVQSQARCFCLSKYTYLLVCDLDMTGVGELVSKGIAFAFAFPFPSLLVLMPPTLRPGFGFLLGRQANKRFVLTSLDALFEMEVKLVSS